MTFPQPAPAQKHQDAQGRKCAVTLASFGAKASAASVL